MEYASGYDFISNIISQGEESVHSIRGILSGEYCESNQIILNEIREKDFLQEYSFHILNLEDEVMMVTRLLVGNKL